MIDADQVFAGRKEQANKKRAARRTGSALIKNI